MRLMRLENTPKGRVVSWLLSRYEEQMKMKKRERRREKWNGMREKTDCPEFQKHLKEGRRDCWKKGQYKSSVKIGEDRMKTKRRGDEDYIG